MGGGDFDGGWVKENLEERETGKVGEPGTWKTKRSERLEKQKLSENLEPGKIRGRDWKAQ